jgi:hypothetical protein
MPFKIFIIRSSQQQDSLGYYLNRRSCNAGFRLGHQPTYHDPTTAEQNYINHYEKHYQNTALCFDAHNPNCYQIYQVENRRLTTLVYTSTPLLAQPGAISQEQFPNTVLFYQPNILPKQKDHSAEWFLLDNIRRSIQSSLGKNPGPLHIHFNIKTGRCIIKAVNVRLKDRQIVVITKPHKEIPIAYGRKKAGLSGAFELEVFPQPEKKVSCWARLCCGGKPELRGEAETPHSPTTDTTSDLNQSFANFK